ncbi:MAG: histidine phosphatase family protein [Beijerinckiaceae bacterium]|uniref:histidine phosphatase family protein n=1 Tax=Methylobacterium sp. TaxID=409 RepID=UPI0025CC3C6B|nr:histidine phosphatase family protein [Methylobacterium sp.]MBX9738681.1 histidine phosphatase family protein [Beijerinckiaceae bacterium]MBX9934360.1 histidine phosphatase family protein [Methylobacterium sp.]
MTPIGPSELILIRHAPSEAGGRLAGRRDVPARLTDGAALSRLGAAMRCVRSVVTSPALRCRQTAEALFPARVLPEDARLWEQDFGAHEGLLPKEVPDLGPLDRAALAQVSPPDGESFAAMAARVTPALVELAAIAMEDGPVAVVAHAGTVRTGLALALEDVPAALAFEVAPLSVTRLRCLPGAFSVVCVNATV